MFVDIELINSKNNNFKRTSMSVDLFTLIYRTDVPRELIEFTEKELQDEGARKMKIQKARDNHFKAVQRKQQALKDFLDTTSDIDWKLVNPYGLPLIGLAITYGIEFLLDTILEKRVYTPTELREIKNSVDYNLITLCRLFGHEDYSEKIRNYVQNYAS